MTETTTQTIKEPVLSEGLETRVELTHLRKVIAQNMAFSKEKSAQVTHIDEADVTDLYSYYKEIKENLEKEGVRMTLLPFLLKLSLSL